MPCRRAVHLVHGHLPLFEARVFDRFAQLAEHQSLVENFLFVESSRVDCLEDADLCAGVFGLARLTLGGVVAPLVVVTGIADLGGQLWSGAQIVLPFLIEGVAQLCAAGSEA
jgi:hypothetical protein